jgi:hypothetical protein
VANETARALPPKVASVLTRAADHAFVSAVTRGFDVSVVVVVFCFGMAAVMVPRRMRAALVQADDVPIRPTV